MRATALVLAFILPACAAAQTPPPPPAGAPPQASTAQQRPAQRQRPPIDTRTDLAALQRTLDSIADAHRGVVGYAIRNLETGERIERRGDETFPTASLIKVPVLVTVYDLVEKGTLSLDDELTVLKIDKVPGSGLLQHLSDGLTITVRDAAVLMSTISDNTATNLLLDRIVIRRVWEKMESLGLRNTKVHSKVFLRSASVAPDSSAKYGLGVTTPNEMATLFELLAQGKAVSPAADSAMIAILRLNTEDMMMQRNTGVPAATKGGQTERVRTECSLFLLPARVVACVLTKENEDTRWIMDSEPQVMMARMGETIVRAWRP